MMPLMMFAVIFTVQAMAFLGQINSVIGGV